MTVHQLETLKAAIGYVLCTCVFLLSAWLFFQVCQDCQLGFHLMDHLIVLYCYRYMHDMIYLFGDAKEFLCKICEVFV